MAEILYKIVFDSENSSDKDPIEKILKDKDIKWYNQNPRKISNNWYIWDDKFITTLIDDTRDSRITKTYTSKEFIREFTPRTNRQYKRGDSIIFLSDMKSTFCDHTFHQNEVWKVDYVWNEVEKYTINKDSCNFHITQDQANKHTAPYTGETPTHKYVIDCTNCIDEQRAEVQRILFRDGGSYNQGDSTSIYYLNFYFLDNKNKITHSSRRSGVVAKESYTGKEFIEKFGTKPDINKCPFQVDDLVTLKNSPNTVILKVLEIKIDGNVVTKSIFTGGMHLVPSNSYNYYIKTHTFEEGDIIRRKSDTGKYNEYKVIKVGDEYIEITNIYTQISSIQYPDDWKLFELEPPKMAAGTSMRKKCKFAVGDYIKYKTSSRNYTVYLVMEIKEDYLVGISQNTGISFNIHDWQWYEVCTWPIKDASWSMKDGHINYDEKFVDPDDEEIVITHIMKSQPPFRLPDELMYL